MSQSLVKWFSTLAPSQGLVYDRPLPFNPSPQSFKWAMVVENHCFRLALLATTKSALQSEIYPDTLLTFELEEGLVSSVKLIVTRGTCWKRAVASKYWLYRKRENEIFENCTKGGFRLRVKVGSLWSVFEFVSLLFQSFCFCLMKLLLINMSWLSDNLIYWIPNVDVYKELEY